MIRLLCLCGLAPGAIWAAVVYHSVLVGSLVLIVGALVQAGMIGIDALYDAIAVARTKWLSAPLHVYYLKGPIPSDVLRKAARARDVGLRVRVEYLRKDPFLAVYRWPFGIGEKCYIGCWDTNFKP